MLSARVLLVPKFEVHDDDDRGSGNTMLDLMSQMNVITPKVVGAYAQAYIEIEEVPHSADYNRNPTIPFQLNINTPLYYPFSLDDSQDMAGSDREEYWYTLLVVAYQYKESLDCDPVGPNQLGITFYGNPLLNLSTIYLEDIRDDAMTLPPNDEDVSAFIQDRVSSVVAHEIGHACGNGDTADHNEGGSMADNYRANAFSAKTILRFRSTPQWQR